MGERIFEKTKNPDVKIGAFIPDPSIGKIKGGGK